ncbi:MAG TPA: lipoprotein LpqV [Mycobacterium sp.]|nr:lipoprotein LpqV [Mycobacterium sp.]
MSSPRCDRVLRAVVVAAAGLALLSGCAPGAGKPVGQPAPNPSANPPARLSPPPGVGVSPGGVTTRVDAPAASTEEEYFQACHAAKTWMDSRPEDSATLVESYLQAVQGPDPAGAGTWNMPWSQLTAARQSAVIVAAQAAADGGCG